MGDHEDDEVGDERGGTLRWLLLLLVIPVVALVVVQLRPDRAPLTSPTATASRTSSIRVVGPRQPVVPRPTGRTPSVIHLTRRPLGIAGDFDLFASGRGVVVRVDFATGDLTTTRVPDLDSSGPVAFVATTAGAVVRPLDSVPGYLVPDGRPARRLTGVLSTGEPVVPGPDPGHVWVDLGNGVDGGPVRLVTPGHRPTGPVIRKPGNAVDWIQPDGGGHPLVDTAGGVFDLLPGGPLRITVGTLLASGPTGWLVVECDDRDRCGAEMVDRETRSRHAVPDFPAALHDSHGLLSPDGTTAALAATTARAGVWLVDLRTGQARALGIRSALAAGPGEHSIAWSPDGRWLFVVDGQGVLEAVDVRTGRVRHLDEQLPQVNQVVVRTAHPPR